MLRHTGMCHPNGLLFHQKSLDMGPTLVKKNPYRRVPFHKICEKKCKISRLLRQKKPLQMGLDLRKLTKKKQQQEQNPVY